MRPSTCPSASKGLEGVHAQIALKKKKKKKLSRLLNGWEVGPEASNPASEDKYSTTFFFRSFLKRTSKGAREKAYGGELPG